MLERVQMRGPQLHTVDTVGQETYRARDRVRFMYTSSCKVLQANDLSFAIFSPTTVNFAPRLIHNTSPIKQTYRRCISVWASW